MIHDLTWSGGVGDWAAATSGWADGASAANWSANDNATINAAASTLTVGAGTTAGSVAVGNTSGDVTLSGSSLTAASLIKTGNGNLILSSANAFGAVSASGGKVVAGVSGALGANTLALDNAILEVTDTTATVVLNNSSTTIGANDASFNIGAGASASLSGAVNTVGTSAGVGVAKGDAQTFNTLTKIGDGKLTFSGNVGSQMTYTTGTGAGVTTAGGIALQIAGGSVELLGAKTLNVASGILLDDLIAGTIYNGMVWNGDVQMNGGTIQINGGNIRGTGVIRAGVDGTATTNTLAQRLNFNSPDVANNVMIATGSTLSLSAASGGSIVMLGGISGDGNVTKVGSGTARLDGANTYTGTTAVNTGTLRVGTGIVGNLGSGAVSVASGATIQFNRDDNATISNVISGLGNVTASSLDHTASLTGANTYTGVTSITSGKLGASVIANGGIVSSMGQSTSAAANLVLNGGSLAYEGAADTSSDRNFTLGVNGGGLSATGTGGLNFTSTTAVATTGASVADTTTSVSSAPTVGQLITGATYQITATGTTDFTLIGAADSGVDTIFVATGPGAGTGTVRSGLAIGTQYRITTLGTTDFVALGASASPAPALGSVFTATANGFGDLGGGKVAYANTNTRNFRLGGSGTGRNSVAAAIVNGVPDGVSFNQNLTSLTKNGTSIWSITGTNTYTGPTIVNSGTLLMDGDNTAATGAVTVLKDCFLGGIGSSGAAVTLADGSGIATKITDWTAASTQLTVASLIVQGNLGVSIDTSGMVNFAEEAKSFTILATGGITGSVHTAVTVTAPNFSGTGTWSLAKSGTAVVLNYAPLPIAATVSFGSASLSQTYSGAPISATATTDPAGLTLSYSYNDGSGATANAPVNAGSYEVIATVTSAGYSGTATGTLVIGKADPVVGAWPTAAAITYGDSLTAATLTGGSVNAQGAFSYDAPDTAPNAGTASQSVTFTPADAANYNSATSTVSVTVNKATPTVTWPTSASAITYGASLSTSVLSGGSGAGTFVFTSPSATPDAGTASQGVTFTPTDAVNYNFATNTVSVTTNKATPTVNTPPSASAITSGQSLSSSSLTGGSASVGGTFAFTAPSTVPTATGSQSVTFTPTDSANYNTASTTASVTVNAAGYSAWAATHNLTGADALSSADPDKDGIKNGVEYVLGGNPKLGDAATIAPAGVKSGSNYTFTFKRTDASESDATVTVEYGNNLSGWTSYSIGATTASPVVVTENDTAADTVVVTIPNASAAKFFARLKVVAP